MGLRVKHVSEPYAGREIAIPEGVDEVRFGRDSGAEIGFPAELDIVSRDHFRLRREVGTWKFVIAKHRPVFAGGRALIDGEELDQAMEVQLAGRGGPRLRLEPQTGAAGNIPKTRVLAEGHDIGDVAAAARTGGRRLALWLGAVTLVLAAVAAGYLLLNRDVSEVAGRLPAMEQKIADVAGKIPSVEEQIAAVEATAGKQLDAQAVLAPAKSSVYQVTIELADGSFSQMGTASVVRLPDGTKALMTNAHITEPVRSYLDPAAGLKVWVIQPKGPDYPRVRVIAARTHPAYVAFSAWTDRLAALRREGRVREVMILGAGYDVGLLMVDEPEKLGEPLALATPQDLAALDTGVPLVMAGYPSDRVAGTDMLRPEPTAQVGAITSVTTFYLFRSDTQPNYLIQHSLPTSGGASGSPIFNAAGRVVALHNATGSGAAMYAMINYGQRIDILQELLDGTADGKLPAYRKEWAEVEDRLTNANPDAIIEGILRAFWTQMDGQSEKYAEQTFTLDQQMADGPHALGAAFEVNLEPRAYLLLAIAQEGRPVMLRAYAENQPIAGSVGGFYISAMTIDNSNGVLTKANIAILDQSSLGAKAVTPGTVQVMAWRGPSYAR
jgi:hypothetical protein